MRVQSSYVSRTGGAYVMRDSEMGDTVLRGGPRIIIVDDDEAIRQALSMLVESFGWMYEAYTSAEAFLENFTAGINDCLVLDLQMPGIAGSDLLEMLSREGVKIPAIVVSAFAEGKKAQQAVQAGALAVLKKPFRDDDLLREIHRALKIPLQ